MPKMVKDSALWPKLIEKAYIVYEGRSEHDRTTIDGGTPK